GRLLFYVLAMVAEFESDLIRRPRSVAWPEQLKRILDTSRLPSRELRVVDYSCPTRAQRPESVHGCFNFHPRHQQPRQLVEIATNVTAVTFVPAVSGPVDMAGNWPILRRDIQYATIHSALVESTGVCGIVVIGDAGVGKTTLARLVTQSLPCPVRWVAGTESARSIPLGVFAHLAGSAGSRDPVGVLAAAREAILAEGRSVRIVATVRSGESVPDAITSLWKDGYLQWLHLTAFTKDECVGLIEQAL